MVVVVAQDKTLVPTCPFSHLWHPPRPWLGTTLIPQPPLVNEAASPLPVPWVQTMSWK